MNEQHKHTGTDGSFRLEAKDSIENCPQTAEQIAYGLANQRVVNPAIPLLINRAGTTYTTGTAAIINQQATTINNLIIALRNIGITL